MAARRLWLALALLAQAPAIHAQIALSANDGKARPADVPDAPRTADNVTVLDLGAQPPRILATLNAPATLVGPPSSVAVSRDSRFAIVTAGQALDAAGAPAPSDIVTVIDLTRPAAPRIAQTLHAGTGAAGVAINPAGTLALVANTGADSVSVFAIEGRSLTPLGTVALDPKSRPVDVAFTGDGRTALVVAQGANSLVRLAVYGQTVTRAGNDIAVGAQPYSLALNPATHMAYVSHLGGRVPSATPGPKLGAVGIIDLAAGRMVGQVDTGVTPEHVGLSPSGRFLEVTVNNGTTAPANSAAYHDHGLMIVYRASGAELRPVAHAETGRWCQGAVWSNDEKRLFLQCSALKQIEVYRFGGSSLTRDSAATIQLDARPGAIATARTH